MLIVFGGSFNPPTQAHLNIIVILRKKFPNAHIILIPVGDKYPKPHLVSFEHRYHMVSLMIADLENVFLSDIEHTDDFKGTFYALNHLKKTFHDDNVYFVIGSDHLDLLDTWIRYEDFIRQYPLIVMQRKGYLSLDQAIEKYRAFDPKFHNLPLNENISSTSIRQNIEKNKDDLHKKVYEYIKKNHLYSEENNV